MVGLVAAALRRAPKWGAVEVQSHLDGSDGARRPDLRATEVATAAVSWGDVSVAWPWPDQVAPQVVGTWYPSGECRIRKVFVCQTMVRRMPTRLPVRKGSFWFVSRLSFVKETFGLCDPLTMPSEQDSGSEGSTSNIGSKNVFDYPVRSH